MEQAPRRGMRVVFRDGSGDETPAIITRISGHGGVDITLFPAGRPIQARRSIQHISQAKDQAAGLPSWEFVPTFPWDVRAAA